MAQITKEDLLGLENTLLKMFREFSKEQTELRHKSANKQQDTLTTIHNLLLKSSLTEVQINAQIEATNKELGYVKAKVEQVDIKVSALEKIYNRVAAMAVVIASAIGLLFPIIQKSITNSIK